MGDIFNVNFGYRTNKAGRLHICRIKETRTGQRIHCSTCEVKTILFHFSLVGAKADHHNKLILDDQLP